MSNDSDIDDLVGISQFGGSSPDLTQTGGGNTSVKTSDGKIMYIKASGVSLADVRPGYGYIPLDMGQLPGVINDRRYEEMEPLAREGMVARAIQETNLGDKGFRPSLETAFHAILDRVVFHVHPTYVNAMVCMLKGEELALDILGKVDTYTWVEYRPPGYPLAMAVREKICEHYNLYGKRPSTVFLQNHGVIISAERASDVIPLTERVLSQLTRFFGKLSFQRATGNPDVERECANIVEFLREYIEGRFGWRPMVRVCNDEVIRACVALEPYQGFLKSGPMFPDLVVYCGPQGLVFEDYDLRGDNRSLVASRVDDFYLQTGRIPRFLVFYGIGVFLLADSEKPLRAMEENLSCHLKVHLLAHKFGKLRYMTREEVSYIANLEGEKYRQSMMETGRV